LVVLSFVRDIVIATPKMPIFNPDDFMYATLLLISVGSGGLIRNVKGPTARKLVSTAVGVGLVAYACGYEGLHPLVVTLGNCALIFLLGPRYTEKEIGNV